MIRAVHRAVLALVLAACVRTEVVVCSDGTTVCPAGNTCIAFHDPEKGFACATATQVEACAGRVTGDYCIEPSAETGLGSRCYDGGCFPIACQDGFVDALETCAYDDRPGAECCCGNGVIDLVQSEGCDDGNFVGHDGCHACEAEVALWSVVPAEEAPARSVHMLAYDFARDRLVLFGGAASFVTLNSTLEYDGAVWTRALPPRSPTGRRSAGFAYDGSRGRIVMFGGASSTFIGETWEYDGRAWVQLLPIVQPRDRVDLAMTYDSVRNRVVMFGGRGRPIDNISVLDDTWEWDGQTWTQKITATRPEGADHAGMAFDPVRGVVVLHGGIANDAMTPVSRVTWEYDGTDWRRVVPPGPSPQGKLVLAWDPITRKVLGFGGDHPGLSSSTWTWDGAIWTKLVLPAGQTPPPRERFAMATVRGRVILAGGCVPPCANDIGDVWAWDGVRWTNITTTPSPAPQVRTNFMSAYDPLRGRLIVFGGAASNTDVHEFDGARWFTSTPVGPPTRSAGAMAFDASRGEAILFGGNGGTALGVLNDTWRWNGATWTPVPLQASPPLPRHGHAMTYDLHRRRVVMFGGTQGTQTLPTLGDTWEWDGATWSRRATDGPPPRRNHALAYDPIRRQTVMFGGLRTSVDVLNDTWVWDGETWRNATPAGLSPSPRSGASMIWDATRRRIVLFAGIQDNVATTDDVYEWDGAAWTFVPIPITPARRTNHALFPVEGGGVASYGGFDDLGQRLPDMPVFRWDIDPARRPASYEACNQSERDRDGLLGCEDDDCWAVCRPLAPPGLVDDPQLPRCGDGMCDAVREACGTCPADCGACPASCGDHACTAGETAATCPGDC